MAEGLSPNVVAVRSEPPGGSPYARLFSVDSPPPLLLAAGLSPHEFGGILQWVTDIANSSGLVVVMLEPGGGTRPQRTSLPNPFALLCGAIVAAPCFGGMAVIFGIGSINGNTNKQSWAYSAWLVCTLLTFALPFFCLVLALASCVQGHRERRAFAQPLARADSSDRSYVYQPATLLRLEAGLEEVNATLASRGVRVEVALRPSLSHLDGGTLDQQQLDSAALIRLDAQELDVVLFFIVPPSLCPPELEGQCVATMGPAGVPSIVFRQPVVASARAGSGAFDERASAPPSEVPERPLGDNGGGGSDVLQRAGQGGGAQAV